MAVTTPDNQRLSTPTTEQLGLLSSDSEAYQEFPYEILKSPEDRMRYLQLTDNLVREMIEKKTEVAIFLDKSARPVAWLMHQLWDQLVPPAKPGDEPYKEPAIKFLNIDREQWGAIVGRTETGMVDVDAIPEERINELRQVMSSTASDELESGTAPDPDKSLLADKRVMVVDEIRVSGDTLHISQRILKRAFPEASEIVPVAWMDGGVKRQPKSGQLSNTNNPVWYSDTKVTGRGVSNRDTTKSSRSHSGRSRIGAYWLSTTFKEPDTEGLQLRREMTQMARDLKAHRLLYRPSVGWKKDIDPIEKRIERINGMSAEQYKHLLMAFRNDPDGLLRGLGRLTASNS